MKKIITTIIILMLCISTAVCAEEIKGNGNFEVVRSGYMLDLWHSFQIDGKYGQKVNDEILIEPVWDGFKCSDADAFDEFYRFNYITAKKDGKWGIIDNKGNIIVEPLYKDIEIQPSRTLFKVKSENDKYGYVNKNGELICEIKYDYASTFDKNNKYAVVGRDFGYTVMDADGNELTEFMPYKLSSASIENGWFEYEKDDKVYVITVDGKAVFGGEYDYVHYEGNNLFAIGNNRKYGIADKNNNIIIPMIYKNIALMENGYIKAETEDMIYYFDRKGNKISESVWHYTDGFIREKFVTFMENGKIGVMDTSGSIVVPAIYEEIQLTQFYTEEFKYFFVKLNGLWGIMNADGTYLIEPRWVVENYSTLEYIGNDYFTVKNKEHKKAIVNKEGKLVTDFIFSDVRLIDRKIFGYTFDDSYIYELKINEPLTEYIDDSEIRIKNTLEVDYMVSNGFVKGYEDGSIRPYDCVTQAEFFTMLSNAEGWQLPQLENATHWAASVLTVAKDKGYLVEIEPENYITFDEIEKLLVKAYGISMELVGHHYSLAAYKAGISDFSYNRHKLHPATREAAMMLIYHYLNTDVSVEDVEKQFPLSEMIYVAGE